MTKRRNIDEEKNSTTTKKKFLSRTTVQLLLRTNQREMIVIIWTRKVLKMIKMRNICPNKVIFYAYRVIVQTVVVVQIVMKMELMPTI